MNEYYEDTPILQKGDIPVYKKVNSKPFAVYANCVNCKLETWKQTQSHKMSALKGEASFVCLRAIDRSQTCLLEIYIAVELPVSAVALTKPLPIVFETWPPTF